LAGSLRAYLNRTAARPGGARRPRTHPAPKSIALALQGGGSHGAFTWGVLDRLLEEDRLKIEAISGASAGAMNAVVLTGGYLEGGPDGAREALASLWRSVAEIGRLAPLGSNPLAHLLGGELGDWLSGSGLQFLTRLASPYQLNPLDLNPLRDLLEELVDFDRLRRNRRIRLFVSATNVHTGSPRLFANRELSSDVLLASSCLPSLHRAVEIDGAHYWDGGFTANPAIFPLVRHGRCEDIVTVHIDTQGHPGLPVTGREISNRLQRIITNAPLLREIQTITDLRDLADPGSKFGRRLRDLALHHILPPEDMTQFETSSSKLNIDWPFLTRLRDIGRSTAENWLAANFDRIGTGSAATLESSLLAPGYAAPLAEGRI
jgi:NTE family protein